MADQQRLWKIWWIAGIPLGWLTTLLVLLADHAYAAGLGGWGSLLDTVRLLIFLVWARLAWRCAGNVANPVWTPIAKGALATGLILSAVF